MIALASIAFNRPRVVSEQIRLLKKNLKDPYALIVFDNSSQELAADEIEKVCAAGGVGYVSTGVTMHHDALNYAGRFFTDKLMSDPPPYIGFLDHDVFPVRETRLIPLIEEAGFYGIGQRHPATGHLYLWPGFCFFSRKWLAGRPLDFSGLRDGDKRNDGDTGSSLWPLFVDEDWKKMYRVEHSYQPIRKPDEYGLQSWGVERMGDWLHFSNASRWMRVPNPDERDRLLFELLAEA